MRKHMENSMRLDMLGGDFKWRAAQTVCRQIIGDEETVFEVLSSFTGWRQEATRREMI